MKTIFLALGQFSHSSDILRGKCLDALLSEFRVVVLTPYLDAESAKESHLPSHPRLLYIPLPLRYPRLWGIMNKYVRHAFVREYDNWIITRHWYYRPTHPLLIRILTALGNLLPSRFPSSNTFSKIERFIARPSRAFRALVKEYAPSLLVSATPGYTPFEAEMIHFAHTLHLPSVAININYDNAYSQAKFIRHTDHLFVWNERMKKEMEQWCHYDSSALTITGCLRFDHYYNDAKEHALKTKEDFLRAKGLNPKKPLIVFTGPSPIMYPPRKQFVELLIGLKEKKLLHGDPNILIRLHPHDEWDIYEPYLSLPEIRIERAGHPRSKGVILKGQKVEMESEDLVNLTETLMYADTVINFVSTIIIEACVFDTPIVSIGFPKDRRIINEYEFNKALINTHCLRLAESPEELAIHLNAYLDNPALDREARRRVRQIYVPFTDGETWKRTATMLTRLANTSS